MSLNAIRENKILANVSEFTLFNVASYYTIIDFNEVDIRIYLPEKVIIH